MSLNKAQHIPLSVTVLILQIDQALYQRTHQLEE